MFAAPSWRREGNEPVDAVDVYVAVLLFCVVRVGLSFQLLRDQKGLTDRTVLHKDKDERRVFLFYYVYKNL